MPTCTTKHVPRELLTSGTRRVALADSQLCRVLAPADSPRRRDAQENLMAVCLRATVPGSPAQGMSWAHGPA